MKLILGGPGTGKTTRLLQILDEVLARGIAPTEVAFVSFTKKAVREAAQRAKDQFGFEEKHLPYFRTLHSLAYRELGLRRDEVLGPAHLREFGSLLGVTISGTMSAVDQPNTVADGDRLLYIEGLARATMRPLEDVYHEIHEGLEFYRLKQFADALAAYKTQLGLVDFTDMLQRYVLECGSTPVRVAFIDEAQDLTPLQWRVAWNAFSEVEELYIAGDDDQAIFTWSGADVNQFLSLKPDETEVLPHSHRLPRAIFDLAASVIGRVEKRYPKKWTPRDDEGEVLYHRSLDGIDLTDGSSWLLLARNSHFLDRYKELAESQGVTYTSRSGNSVDPEDARAILAWEKNLRKGLSVSGRDAQLVVDRLGLADVIPVDQDGRYTLEDLGLEDRGLWHDAFENLTLRRREYYLSVLRRGEKLLEKPRVHIDTIHSQKGGEADQVVILSDWTKRTAQGFENRPDDEHRVFYVGATRARERLHIVLPTGSSGYQF